MMATLESTACRERDRDRNVRKNWLISSKAGRTRA